MNESSNNPIDEYDSATYYHWREFENRCLKASGDEFQRLFEDIMVRAKPGFIRIRPYGNIGDRKCDGLFRAESTFFQVYSPDELEQSKVQKKINDDLDGAVSHWGDALKKWVFVYNVKRGLPPDIPRTLQQKEEQYPNIQIDHLSNDGLWEIARELSLQQRVEVLGVPSPATLGHGNSKSELLFEVSLKSDIEQIAFEDVESAFTYPVPLGFFGREDTLDQVYAAIQNHGTVVIGGISGIGKTSVAAKLAERLNAEHPVLWLDCESYSQVEQVISRVASFLSKRFNDHALARVLRLRDADVNYRAKVAMASLCKYHCLFIWDQFDCRRNQSLMPLLKISSQLGQQSKLLITTQEWIPSPNLLNQPHFITLSKLDWKASLSLMCYHLERLGIIKPSDDVLFQAYKRVDGHPYFMCLLMVLVETFSLQDLLNEIPCFTNEVFNYIQNKIFDNLTLVSKKLLLRLSVLNTPFQITAIKYLGNSNEDYEAFSTLARKFIVARLTRESAYYEIHNLVREWCEAKISQSEILDIHERAVKYYESLHDKNFPEIWELMCHALEAGIDNKAEEAANKILSGTLFYGLYDFALDLTNQLVEMPHPKNWYTLHFARGRIFRFKEQFDAALEEYQAAIKLANTNIYKDVAKFEAASILVTLVELNTEIEDDYWSIAKSYYTDLLRSENEEIRITALFTLGDLNTRDGYLEEGLRQILEALSQAEAAKFERTIYQIYYRLGRIHSKVLSDQQQAIQYLERSLAIQQKNSDKLGGNDIDACYHISLALAELYEQLGCHLDSARAWETCVEINYVLQLKHRLVQSLFHLARQQSLLKQFDLAYENLQVCLNLIREQDKPDERAEQSVLASLANVSWNLNNFEKSIEYFLEHIYICELEGTQPSPFIWMGNLNQADPALLKFSRKGVHILELPDGYIVDQLLDLASRVIARRPELSIALEKSSLFIAKKPRI